MCYEIGQIIPLQYKRGIQGAIMPEPLWYCFEVVPQADAKAKAWLDKQGVDAWYPVESAWKPVRGQRRKVQYERRVIPGYVLGHFLGWPQWDILFDSRYIRGVVSTGGKPAPISEEAMLEMAQVPKALAEQRRAMLEARTLRVGDKATVKDGPLAGQCVEITTINGRAARFISDLFGGREIEANIEALEKRMEK